MVHEEEIRVPRVPSVRRVGAPPIRTSSGSIEGVSNDTYNNSCRTSLTSASALLSYVAGCPAERGRLHRRFLPPVAAPPIGAMDDCAGVCVVSRRLRRCLH